MGQVGRAGAGAGVLSDGLSCSPTTAPSWATWGWGVAVCNRVCAYSPRAKLGSDDWLTLA